MPKVGSLGAAELVVLLFVVALMLFPLFLFWRVFGKAGMSRAWALLCLIPGIGYLLALMSLAFGRWSTSPAMQVNTIPGSRTAGD